MGSGPSKASDVLKQRFISNVDDTSPQKHFAKWEQVVARIERVNNVSFPGNVHTATSAEIQAFILDNLKTSVRNGSEASFKQCFNDEGEAIECLAQVEAHMAASNAEIGQVFHPIPVAPPISSEATSATAAARPLRSIPSAPPLSIATGGSSIPAAPPITTAASSSAIPLAPPLLAAADDVVLGQVVNPQTGKVEAVVGPTGMRAVTRPFTPKPGSKVVEGNVSPLLEAIRNQGGKPLRTAIAKDRSEKSESVASDVRLLAASGPGGKPVVVPVAEAGAQLDLLSQIRAGRALKKAAAGTKAATVAAGGGGSLASALAARSQDPMLAAALDKHHQSMSGGDDDDEDAFDDDDDWQ